MSVESDTKDNLSDFEDFARMVEAAYSRHQSQSTGEPTHVILGRIEARRYWAMINAMRNRGIPMAGARENKFLGMDILEGEKESMIMFATRIEKPPKL